MKRNLLLALALLPALVAGAQQYSFTFRLDGRADTMLYIGIHHRDALKLVDSARMSGGSCTFSGKRAWPRGVYALVAQDRTKAIGDFCIDASRKFTIAGNADMAAASVKVKGCPSNEGMFGYIATIMDAKKEMETIRERMKSPAEKAKAEADEKALMDRMTAFEQTARHPKTPNIYFELQNACDNPEPPEEAADKAVWYRLHYWDPLFGIAADGQAAASPLRGSLRGALMDSPQLFNKMNYFFFGILYYADSDTICREIDRLAARIGDDTAMLHYVFDHIEPRYFRSTKNIGWDAVWCHLAGEYYLKGRCPWASEGTLHNIKYNYERIRQSLIGAHGQELWMIDTTQIDAPGHWVSSHRFPEKYVILWFWDPDCHHCQEQSAALKVLYDSLQTAPDRRFEVYAVGYESDIQKWVRYVREHDFRWVNVGGPNVNIDYQQAYNVHGAPTMIILNENRDIIMNKTLPAKSLLQFLDQYEKKQRR